MSALKLSFAWMFYLLLLHTTEGFYLPGLAPISYCEKQDSVAGNCKSHIPLFVNRLVSMKTIIPYEYSRFDFCPPPPEHYAPSENLGQIVIGDRIQASPYNISFKENKCATACEKKYTEETVKGDELNFIKNGIRLNYQHYWIIDNMPVTWCYQVSTKDAQIYCSTGFPIGCYVDSAGTAKDACFIQPRIYTQKDTYYIFNHVRIILSYHSGAGEDWNGARLTSAQVWPSSCKDGCKNPECPEAFGIKADETKAITIPYTYQVVFTLNNFDKWSSRWDYILESIPSIQSSRIVMNSLVFGLFLSGIVAIIMLRTLHKDIARYNQLDIVDDAQKEFGWKLVHGDVFRPPGKGMLLSVMLGTGTQVVTMTSITLVFGCLGILSPANRGALMTTVLLLFVCFGGFAGYVAARIYKLIGGERWKTNALMTSLLFPGIIFAIFFVLNLVLQSKQSSAAIPFGTLVALLALWFGISVPLVFVGAYFGFRKPAIKLPVRTNQIPRQIPEQRFYSRSVPAIIVGSIFSFACIFIQFLVVFNRIWSHQIYYMFGFLLLNSATLMITVSEACILLCYCHLRAEDYHWWWRSFLTGALTAIYLFMYSIYYFHKSTIVGTTSLVLYFGYTSIMVILFSLYTGTIGFFACFFFVRKIYGVVKVDC